MNSNSAPSLRVLSRRITACTVTVICLVLALVNTFSLLTASQHFTLLLGLQIVSSLFTSFAFLVVGLLVWLFARDRQVAQLLAAFTSVLAVCFASVTGGLSADPTLAHISDCISSASAALSVPFLALFLFHFPVNYFSPERRNLHRMRVWLLRVYLFLLMALCFLVIAVLLGKAFPALNTAFSVQYGDGVKALYYLFGIAGIFLASLASIRGRGQDTRTRQQFRLLAGGVVLSLLPVLILAVLPSILSGATEVDGRVSSLALVILAISLGYSVLRNQLLVLDTFVRKIASILVACVGLAIVAYLALSLNSILSSQKVSFAILCSFLFLSVLGPYVWTHARGFTDVLFFPDVLRYRRLLEKPAALLGNEVLTLDRAAELLTLSAATTFETLHVAFLSLAPTGETFRACPPLETARVKDRQRHEVLQRVQQLFALSQETLETGDGDISAHLYALELLRLSTRPMLLSELLRSQSGSLGLERFFTPATTQGDDMLLAPLRVQGKMIGILILGERADHQRYAGPDFDIVQVVLSRFAETISTAYFTRELHLYNEELHEKNVQLSEAYEHQKELDVLKDEFIMIASHELRTPLTSVKGYIELLLDYNGMDEALPAPMRETFLQKASLGIDDLTLLISNMTGAVDIEKIAGQITVKEFGLCDATTRISGMLDALPESQGRTFEVSIPPDLQVVADEQRFGQVLRNLLVNALKYSAPQSPVRISSSVQGDMVEIHVRDWGNGVPQSEQHRLFERFARLERDMNSPVRGSGLGLYICKHLVEAMRGRIWVESSGVEGEGSTFTFSLPRTNVYQKKEKRQQEGKMVAA